MRSRGHPTGVPSDAAVMRFQNYLLQHNLAAFVRESRGRDISAACGQLRFESRSDRKLTPLQG